jgi:hypothetical protein
MKYIKFPYQTFVIAFDLFFLYVSSRGSTATMEQLQAVTLTAFPLATESSFRKSYVSSAFERSSLYQLGRAELKPISSQVVDRKLYRQGYQPLKYFFMQYIATPLDQGNFEPLVSYYRWNVLDFIATYTGTASAAADEQRTVGDFLGVTYDESTGLTTVGTA